MSFHAVSFSQMQMTEKQVVEALNRAGDLSSRSLQHQQQGEWQAAEETINESLGILNSLPATENRERIYGQTLDIWGQLYFARGEFDLALKTWENSEITYRNLSDRDRVRKSYINQSRALQRLGLYDRACDALLISTGLRERLERFPSIASLNCKQFTQLEKALLSEKKDDEGKTIPLSSEENWERLTQALGGTDISHEDAKEIETILTTPSDRLSLIAGIRLGNVLRSLGELEISLNLLTRSRKHGLEFPQQMVAINLSVGNTERALGNRLRAYREAQEPPSFEFQFCRSDSTLSDEYEKALKAYYENYLLARQDISLGSTNTIVQSYLNYLQLAFEVRGEDETIEETIVAIVKHDSDTIKRMQSELDYLSEILPKNLEEDNLVRDYVHIFACSERPNWNLLRSQLQKVFENARRRQDWKMESSIQGEIGRLYEQEYKSEIARKKEGDKSKNNLEQLLDKAFDYTHEALKIVKSKEQEVRDINYKLEWQLGRIAKYKNDFYSARWHYQEAYRNLQKMRLDLAAFNQEIQYDLRDKVEPVYRELVSFILRGNPTQKDLDFARKAIESLQLIQLDNFLQDTCTKAEDLKIEQIDKQAAVIYTIVLPDSLEIILSLPNSTEKSVRNSLKYESLPIPRNLQRIDRVIRKYLEDKQKNNAIVDASILEYLKNVYDWLIKPFEKDLEFEKSLEERQIKTLILALDGSLRSIPIAALYDGKQYLIEKVPVAITPSLQLLEPRKIDLKTLKVLAAGRSDFQNLDGWDDLNKVGDELDAIGASISRTEKLLDKQFTSQSLREKINILDFPIVHIATHGTFALSAKDTFIFAWDRPINLEQLGELLRVNDPTGLKDIELLIFSACQTAEGNKRATLGMAGVAFEAGARSIIATLWNVNDNSTSLLMSDFYRELDRATREENIVNKAEALRFAQLELLNSKTYSHPHFWAPFILVGNWL